MIITNCGVPDLSTEMIDPIVEQVIRRVLKELALTDFIGDNLYINSDYQTGSRTNDSELIPVLQSNRLDCDVTHITDPNKVKWEVNTTRGSIEYGNTKFEAGNLFTLFEDKPLKTTIMEHTLPCTINIACTLSCLERAHANSVYSTLISTLGGSEPTLPVDVLYSYLVPDPVIFLLGYLYKMNNFTDKNFVTYLKENSSSIINYIMNKNIEKPNYGYVINKSEIELLVETTIQEDKPQAIKNNKSTNHYTIGFTLTCQFSRPDILFMTYPIIMKNQLVDEIFLPSDITTRKDVFEHTTHPYVDIDAGHDTFRITQKDELFRQPFYDNFLIPNLYLDMMGFKPFYCGAFPLDLSNTTTQIDLGSNFGTDTNPIRIKQAVLDIINNRGLPVFSGTLPIAIVIFVDDTMIEPSTITLNNLIITIPNRDINKIYRLVIYENTEISHNVQSLRVLKYVLFTGN